MTLFRILIILCTAFLLGGCLYVAPIEEDPDPEDRLPYIDEISGVSPSMGLVTVNLDLGGNQEFIVSTYGDENENQTLYHRIVIDYRLAEVSTNPVYAVVPKQIKPGERDRISYRFAACTAALSYPGAISDGKTINLYIVLSDEPFTFQNQLFSALNFAQPFETSTEHRDRSIWVQWTLRFQGTCPKE